MTLASDADELITLDAAARLIPGADTERVCGSNP